MQDGAPVCWLSLLFITCITIVTRIVYDTYTYIYIDGVLCQLICLGGTWLFVEMGNSQSSMISRDDLPTSIYGDLLKLMTFQIWISRKGLSCYLRLSNTHVLSDQVVISFISFIFSIAMQNHHVFHRIDMDPGLTTVIGKGRSSINGPFFHVFFIPYWARFSLDNSRSFLINISTRAVCIFL